MSSWIGKKGWVLWQRHLPLVVEEKQDLLRNWCFPVSPHHRGKAEKRNRETVESRGTLLHLPRKERTPPKLQGKQRPGKRRLGNVRGASQEKGQRKTHLPRKSGRLPRKKGEQERGADPKRGKIGNLPCQREKGKRKKKKPGKRVRAPEEKGRAQGRRKDLERTTAKRRWSKRRSTTTRTRQSHFVTCLP